MSLLSIIITVLNEGEEVRKTVDSVHEHTEPPYEIIVVDDGSADGCCDSITGDKVRVIRHTERVGSAASRN